MEPCRSVDHIVWFDHGTLLRQGNWKWLARGRPLEAYGRRPHPPKLGAGTGRWHGR